ncbi:TetR/AcrR family transcriptional regulator [Nocardia zapadnayensis]|uniref:TetR/AcrR family transcriptional regulator n=1 Tax=Nocardia rhamnosiphila TaxID=426716 RepID=UPI002246900C|nr:TetR/AcrR family transcriptional regulator [Nocardia zapadnayensis]MCX0275242.1 TetR/AcrR family transcriptional regulator [Nocardia zapadnayensis]
MTQRAPSGAAVLKPDVTAAIIQAVLAELVERSYARLSMEGVAKRAGTSKSALYRRWPTKQDMVLAVLADISVPMADVTETGDLRRDMRAAAESMAAWLASEPYAKIIPDLIAEAHRTPALAEAISVSLAKPRRAHLRSLLTRAIDRGDLPADTDMEMAQDLVAALIYWRMVVRQAPAEPRYLDHVTDTALRALRATGTETRET